MPLMQLLDGELANLAPVDSLAFKMATTSEPRFKSPKKEVDPTALEEQQKLAEYRHQLKLQEKVEKATSDLEKTKLVREKVQQERDQKKDAIQMSLEEAEVKRQQQLNKKVESARHDVEHAKEVHDRIKAQRQHESERVTKC